MSIETKKIIIRKGLESTLEPDTLDEGELGYITNTNELIVGTSTSFVTLQKKLVSGVTLKTVNNQTLFGSENISIAPFVTDKVEWIYLATDTQGASNIIDITSAELGESWDNANYDYKFVLEAVTTAVDTAMPDIRINNDTTAGKHSFVYQRVQLTGATTGTQTLAGEYGATSTSILTGVNIGTASTGAITHVEVEFIVSRSRIFQSGVYSYIVKGTGHAISAEGTQGESSTFSGTTVSTFTGGYGNGNANLTSVRVFSPIRAGAADSGIIRIYKRKK
jgi:hypothetical protein